MVCRPQFFPQAYISHAISMPQEQTGENGEGNGSSTAVEEEEPGEHYVRP